MRAKTLRMDEKWSLRAEDGWATASQDFKDGRKNGAIEPRTVALGRADGGECADHRGGEG